MPSAKTKAKRSAERRSSQPRKPPGDGWKTRRAGGVEILVAESLAAIPWLAHGFSTRPGGDSHLGGERVLNLGFTDWDARDRVTQNRGKLRGALGAEEMPLVALRQIHSDVAHVFFAAPAEPPQGDAVISGEPGLLLTVQTADCVPILLVDRKRKVVAAVHAGWRGTLARIATKALGRMRLEFGTRPEDVTAALGPAIGRCCYEVGPEVAQAFASQFAAASDWFDGPFEQLALGEEPNPLPWLTMMPPGHQPPPERVRLDLRAANRWQLEDAGVAPGNTAVSTLCTACRTDLLFSYRREGPGTGRLMAAIGIRARAH
jgi:YfiH family protein